MEGKEPSELYALTVSEHLKLVKPVLWAHTLVSKGRCPRWLTLNIYVIYILWFNGITTSTWGYNLRIAVLRQIPRCNYTSRRLCAASY